MSSNKNLSIKKSAIADSFNQAASTYDEAAVLQLEVGKRLEERLDFIKLSPSNILDIGASTGRFSEKLQSRYPDAQVISLDIAHNMLAFGRSHYQRNNPAICADAEHLPFSSNSMDLVFSNLTIQWLSSAELFAKECLRVLKPGGLLFFTTLGPDTLFELKQAWQAVDDEIHVNEFLDMHTVGDALHACQYSDPVMDSEFITLTYSDIKKLMQDLKLTGTNNLHTNRRQTLTGKNKLRQLVSAYQSFKTSDDRYPASYEVIYGHAWKAHQTQKKESAPKTHRISVEDILRNVKQDA